MKKHALLMAAALAALAATRASAQFVMDGSKDAGYGTAISVQDTLTRFGTNPNSDPINYPGSEIDAVYAKVSGGRLHVLIAGNLENNFNKMEIYFDSVAGGVNSIVGADLPAQVDGFCCTIGGGVNLPDPASGALQRQDGLTFDAGFNADYYLTFSHGGESTGSPAEGFWALTAHYADLTNGTAGATHSLGMQLAQRGLPNVLRGPLEPDFDNSFTVDGGDFLVWQRNRDAFDGTTTQANKSDGDANDDNLVDDADFAVWKSRFGDQRQLTDHAFNPNGSISSNLLLGPALPDLAQGQLIDKNYAATHSGLGVRELEFTLAVDTVNDPNNTLNHRDLDNSVVQLQMALDNSNVAGVSGANADADPMGLLPGDNPADVMTGLEFSIPLSQIGNPAGAIKMVAFVNGNGHNYASNQFAGDGLWVDDNIDPINYEGNPGGNGLGGFTGTMGGVNLLDFPGDQFVSIANPAVAAGAAVPEPAAGVLFAAAALVLARRKR
jgi:hypothetical protein